ncbi:MAG: hypothetical protein PGN11_13900 [Quadrisphaera sp.]
MAVTVCPAAAARSRPPPVEPCSSSDSPSRADAIGRTTAAGVGVSRTTATCATSALSSTSCSAARSVTWRWP